MVNTTVFVKVWWKDQDLFPHCLEEKVNKKPVLKAEVLQISALMLSLAQDSDPTFLGENPLLNVFYSLHCNYVLKRPKV